MSKHNRERREARWKAKNSAQREIIKQGKFPPEEEEKALLRRAAYRDAYRAAHPGNFARGWKVAWAKLGHLWARAA